MRIPCTKSGAREKTGLNWGSFDWLAASSFHFLLSRHFTILFCPANFHFHFHFNFIPSNDHTPTDIHITIYYTTKYGKRRRWLFGRYVFPFPVSRSIQIAALLATPLPSGLHRALQQRYRGPILFSQPDRSPCTQCSIKGNQVQRGACHTRRYHPVWCRSCIASKAAVMALEP